MTQPSIVDQTYQPSNLLFPARASPFVCVTDTIDAVYHLTYELLNATPWRKAALNVCKKRQRDRGIATADLEKSWLIRQHPKASLVLFLGPLTQAIKLFSFHGLLWAKILAGIYLSSYMILAGLLVVARDDDSMREALSIHHPDFEDLTPRLRLTSWPSFILGCTSLTASLLFCSWEISQVCYSGEGDSELDDIFSRIQPSILSLFFFVGLLVGNSMRLLSSWICTSYIVIGSKFCIDALNLALGISTASSGWKIAFGASIYLLVYATELYFICTRYVWWMVEYRGWLARLSDGSGVILTGVGLTWAFMATLAIIFERLGFPESLLTQASRMDRSFLLVLPFFVHLFVALLYFSYMYDPTGTIRPGWTERLG